MVTSEYLDALESQLKADPTGGGWEVGGPFPAVSIIVCVDPGICSGPDAEPPCYDSVCSVDIGIQGAKHLNKVSIQIAELIVVCRESAPRMAREIRELWAENAALRSDLKRTFLSGFIEGLKAFAWWKDGTQYVGTCGTTLQKAIDQAKEEAGIHL
jgi:hypothetical protein